ncbi:MAG: hypothetical protein ABIY52_16610 [Gemmatimonadaceae bacterium]
MLRRLSRPLSALFALWFALVLVDPGVLHACPMHGGVHATTATSTMSHEQASHAGHHGAPAHDTNLCSCVGQCSAAATTIPVPQAATFAVPAHVAQPLALFHEPEDDAPASPGLALPFANGPPQG